MRSERLLVLLLVAGCAHATTTTTPPPATRDLGLRIIKHDIALRDGTVTATTYVLQNVAPVIGGDLLITIVGPDAPDSATRALQSVLDAAITDPPHVGGWAVGLKDGRVFGGLAFVEPRLVPGITFKPHSISLILLTAPEAMVARRQGVTRILTNLGRKTRIFPTPGFTQPHRDSVFTPEMAESSILQKVHPLAVDGLRVVKEGDARLTLRADRTHAKAVAGLFAGRPDKQLAVVTELDFSADSCMVWSPGQQHPEAINVGGVPVKRTCGAFLIVADDGVREQFSLVEDGFALIVGDQAWSAFRDALEHEKDVTIPAAGERPEIRVEWTDDVY